MKQISVSKENVHRVVWTDEDPLLKDGNSIRFKDECDFWHIDNVYSMSLEKNDIKRTWHVGGL